MLAIAERLSIVPWMVTILREAGRKGQQPLLKTSNLDSIQGKIGLDGTCPRSIPNFGGDASMGPTSD